MMGKYIRAIMEALLVILAAYLIITVAALNAKIRNLDAEKEKEFSVRLDKARNLARKDLEEKYQADMVSYRALAKRLDSEREKARK